MVKELGYQVIGKTASGENAVQLAVDHEPDLILMDIRLKGQMDGIEAVQKIKEQLDTHVIYLTGNSDKSNYDRAIATECVDLISKPFTIRELTNSLKLVS